MEPKSSFDSLKIFSCSVMQIEVQTLRKQLSEKDTQLTARSTELKSEDAELAWLDVLRYGLQAKELLRVSTF
jgi:hypothetical protein